MTQPDPNPNVERWVPDPELDPNFSYPDPDSNNYLMRITKNGSEITVT